MGCAFNRLVLTQKRRIKTSADKRAKRLKNPCHRFNIHLEYYVGVYEQTVLKSAGESS